MEIEFKEWPKIGRIFRDVIVTEKIDGTNAAVHIDDNGNVVGVQSRSRLITPTDDNHGFAKFVFNNPHSFAALGPGLHFGEWAGSGIQKRYGNFTGSKVFWLFNARRWTFENLPEGIKVVPTLYDGVYYEGLLEETAADLRVNGSLAYPGAKAEGYIVYWPGSNVSFKFTLDGDGHKG